MAGHSCGLTEETHCTSVDTWQKYPIGEWRNELPWRRIVVDTGPIVALLNKRDQYHEWAVQTFDGLEPPIHTCEPVLTETMWLVRNLAEVCRLRGYSSSIERGQSSLSKRESARSASSRPSFWHRAQ